MRKFVLMLMLMCGFVFANAQIATENSKFKDNWYWGVEGGVFTPLKLDNPFPLNAAGGLKIGRDITPTFGLQAEGIALFNNNGLNSAPTGVKATNVGLNGTLNLSNLFYGYKGKPRWFEVQTNTGIGWLHTWDSNVNNLSAKTGVDFLFNLGKGHSFVLTPQVLWNLDKLSDIQFNKNNAQLGATLSYVYHFKNSNGTHSFKTYDIGAMNEEINQLRNRRPEVKVIEKEKIVVQQDKPMIFNPYIVNFSQNSSILSTEAMRVLDTIPSDAEVDVIGTASPEGTEEHNIQLSQDRANAVATYLRDKRIKVRNVEGIGVVNETTQRTAIVYIN